MKSHINFFWFFFLIVKAVSHFIRPRVLHQHSLTMPQWEDRIKNAWSKLAGIPRFDVPFMLLLDNVYFYLSTDFSFFSVFVLELLDYFCIEHKVNSNTFYSHDYVDVFHGC